MAGVSVHKSTIVRTNIGNRFRRSALAFAERDAPWLGARLAVRMWMTVPRTKAWPALTEPGERVLLRAAGRRTASVAAESWGDGDGPCVYLLHGWGGYRGQMGAFVRPLADAGFRVVAVDALGHGESGPGWYGRGRGLMPDFTAALEAAIDRFGPPQGIIAHSMGAATAAVAALDGLAAGRLVLIAPIPSPGSAIDLYAALAGIGPRVRARMPRRIERIARKPVRHFDAVSRAAERDELAPALIIHDVTDRIVPFDLSAALAAAWPGGQLERTEGLGHGRILADPRVVGRAVEFVAGVPAGAPAPGTPTLGTPRPGAPRPGAPSPGTAALGPMS